MILNNINVQIKASSNNDISVKSSATKDSESNFSKVFKGASTKNKIDNIKCKLEAILNENQSSPVLEKSEAEQLPKAEKDLNKLVELLLLSCNTNQNLINLLTSSKNIDKNELKDLLKKMLNDNLLGDVSTKDNALNVKLVSFLSNEEAFANENTNKQEISIDEITKIILSNKGIVDEGIDKLSSDITDKLLTDKTFKADALSNLLEKAQKAIVHNDNSLKELILNELKEKTNFKISLSDIASKNTKALKIESIPVKAFKTDLSSNLITKALNINDGKTEALQTDNSKTEALNDHNIQTIALDAMANKSNPKFIKPSDNTSDKVDLLLKQLLDGDNSKNNKDYISDKIASVINRFETVRIDKPIIAEGNLSINKANFNADFIKTVKFMDLSNLKELSVKVIPKDLGEIVIRLSMDSGVMKANIIATNKDTYNLLNSQLPAISNQLSEQNMTIQNFSLSLNNGDNFLFNGDGSSNQNTKQQGKNNINIDGIEDMDLQNEQYFDDPSSVNILA